MVMVFVVLGTGLGILAGWDSGFGIRDSGFGIRGWGLGIGDSGFGIRDSGSSVSDLGVCPLPCEAGEG
ncbi:hypothetical protein EYC45_14610, partial [Pseudoxanthomonas winnipegensis]